MDPKDPTPPYEDEGYQFPDDQGGSSAYGGMEEPGITTAANTAVGGSKNKILLVLIVALIIIVLIIYNLFIKEAPPPPPPPATGSEAVAPNSAPLQVPVFEPPAPPEPVITTPEEDDSFNRPPVPELPLPDAAVNPVITPHGPNYEQMMARRKSTIMVRAGNATEAPKTTRGAGAVASSDPNLAFQRDLLASSEAEVSVATNMGNLNSLIAQGKIVNSVLETAINTDLPGTLRAIVSRDTYAESGRGVLIPKGSRLIGQYNTGIKRGQRRVYVVWTRMMRPDGVDIQIGSPAIDQLGRSGLAGDVDNKFFEIYTAAILTSAVTITVAYAGEAITGEDDVTTTSNSDGSTTTTGSAGALAVADSVDQFGSITENIVDSLFNTAPTITVDQGTLVNVFVNRDLIFPSGLSGATHIIE